MPYLNIEQDPTTQPDFSSDTEVNQHERRGKLATRIGAAAVIATAVVGAWAAIHGGAEAPSSDLLRDRVAAVSYFDSSTANTAKIVFEAGQESSSPAGDTPNNQSQGSDLAAELQRADLPEVEYDKRSAADTPSSEREWPSGGGGDDTPHLPGSVVYD